MVRSPFPVATDLNRQADLVRRWRYGVIQVEQSTFQAIRYYPWPKLVSHLEMSTWGRWQHRRLDGDRCWLYFNAPLAAPGFLTLAYLLSTSQTRWSTIRTSLETLDRVAEIRRANALVCELSNMRLSDRLMDRMGWEPHCRHLRGRHFIKRFYGVYPTADKRPATELDSRLSIAP